MSDSPSKIAYDALNLGKQNARDIEAHEDLCAERYRNINESIAELKSEFRSTSNEQKQILKWAGTTAFGIIITMLGFLGVQVYNANQEADRERDRKFELLQRQQQPFPHPQVALPPVDPK